MFMYNGYYLEITPDRDIPNLLNGGCPEVNFYNLSDSYDDTIRAFKNSVDNYILTKKEVNILNYSNLIATFRAKAKKAHQKYHEAKRLNDTIFEVNLYQNLIEEMIETIEELAISNKE